MYEMGTSKDIDFVSHQVYKAYVILIQYIGSVNNISVLQLQFSK